MHSNAPIIILSGDGSRQDKLAALNAGADDYIQKPFDTDEMVARIKTHLRRHAGAYDACQPTDDADSFDGWILDAERCLVFNKNNVAISLTAKEFQLLQRLTTEPARVVTRHDLCEAIREKDYVPTPRAIDIKITRIRKKIGDSAAHPQVIKTVRGIGYVVDAKKVQKKN
jgi:two-component system phosphate regulon response regulator OmpR